MQFLENRSLPLPNYFSSSQILSVQAVHIVDLHKQALICSLDRYEVYERSRGFVIFDHSVSSVKGLRR